MKWRKLETEEIIETVKNPDKKEVTNFGRINAFKKIGLKLMKVTYIEEKDHIIVISAVDKNK
jgi:hypothetical protein